VKYLLDTNICTYIIKLRPAAVFAKFRNLAVGQVAISAITNAGQPSSLGHVRRWLRDFAGQSAIMPQDWAVGKEISAPSPDLPARWRALSRSSLLHPCLTSRGIPAVVQEDPLWTDRIRTDQCGNLCFAHYYRDRQVCGWEVKNAGFTGFSGGGKKGIWAAGVAQATEIVICESAIDCLSHAALFSGSSRGYVSVAGQLSSAQLELIQVAIGDRMAIIATDADDAGDKLAERIAVVLPRSQRHRPEQKDWNDDLRAEAESEGVRI
jgi:5S rRNA maturation endonuclease (ribonuclease M5)